MSRARQAIDPADMIPSGGYSEPPELGRQVVSYKQLKLTLVPQNIVAVSDREFQKAAEMEAFMQELVTIVVHKTTDKNDEPWVPVGCNGEHVWLPRGTYIEIPRKFLESLMRTTRSYKSVENADPRADEGYTQQHDDTLRFRFDMVEDGNPKGRAWMRRVMYQG